MMLLGTKPSIEIFAKSQIFQLFRRLTFSNTLESAPLRNRCFLVHSIFNRQDSTFEAQRVHSQGSASPQPPYLLGFEAQTIDFPTLSLGPTRERLIEVGFILSVSLPLSARKERQIKAFVSATPAQLAAVENLLQRQELNVICRQLGLPYDAVPARTGVAGPT